MKWKILLVEPSNETFLCEIGEIISDIAQVLYF